MRASSKTALPLVALVLVFGASRVAVALLGFHFESGGINGEVQAVDPELLRTHLLQSIWYLHSQPPLWNLLVGITLKLFPTHWPQAWHAAFLVLGLVETLALYLLLRGFDVGREAAAAIAALVLVSPPLLLYEWHFGYDYPTIVLVTLVVLGVQRLVATPTFARALGAFSAAAALVFLRSLFQIGWLLVLLLLVALAVPRARRRRVLAAAAVPCLLVVGLYVKNWALFGVTSTSSWEGMALARVAEHGYSARTLRRLVAAGDLHRVSLVQPLSGLDAYRRAHAAPPPEHTGIPVLDEVAGREYPRNLHNKAYIEISREYWHDDLWLVRHDPGRYARSVVTSTRIFFRSPDYGGAVEANAATIRGYEDAFRSFVHLLPAAYVVALLGGLLVSVRSFRNGRDGRTAACAVTTFTVLYVFVVGNLAELGENYRFRLVLDPVVVALLAYLVVVVVRRRRGRPGRPLRTPD